MTRGPVRGPEAWRAARETALRRARDYLRQIAECLEEEPRARFMAASAVVAIDDRDLALAHAIIAHGLARCSFVKSASYVLMCDARRNLGEAYTCDLPSRTIVQYTGWAARFLHPYHEIT